MLIDLCPLLTPGSERTEGSSHGDDFVMRLARKLGRMTGRRRAAKFPRIEIPQFELARAKRARKWIEVPPRHRKLIFDSEEEQIMFEDLLVACHGDKEQFLYWFSEAGIKGRYKPTNSINEGAVESQQ